MKMCFKQLIVIGLLGITFPSAAQIPVDDPAQFIKILEDFGQSETAQDEADTHKTYQSATKKIIGIQNATTKLSQEKELQKVLLGKSNVLSNTFEMLGINYQDPTKAVSNDTLKTLRSELVMPSTKEERSEMTEKALQEIAMQQAQTFQALATQSLAEAWVARTEAAAKAETISAIGKDIDNSLTQTDVLIVLIRISAETAAELNARSTIQSSNLMTESTSALRDIK